jgi:SAM-dependent methyltransferase
VTEPMSELNQYFDDTQNGYSNVADEYAEKFFGELAYKPLDRDLLDRLARNVGALGPICDMGGGPGQIARYLKDHGADSLGVDLSPNMVEVARKLSPDISFFQGNMLALDLPGASWGGIAAFYSLIHIPRPLLPDALRELRRVLRPGGLLLMSYHVGEETVHLDEWWEKPVKLDFNFLQTSSVTDLLAKAGLVVEDVIERDPYPEEHPSRRAYIFARKPYGID